MKSLSRSDQDAEDVGKGQSDCLAIDRSTAVLEEAR